MHTEKSHLKAVQFETEFRNYAAIHQNHLNHLLHVLGIPVIVLGLQVLLLTLGGLPTVLLVSLLCSLPILRRSIPAWLILLAFFALLTPLALFCGSDISFATGLAYAGLLFIAGWGIQFLGHFFEKQHPELLNSPINILIGPIFVMCKVAPFLMHILLPMKLSDNNSRLES